MKKYILSSILLFIPLIICSQNTVTGMIMDKIMKKKT